jgi:hypothetical protein
MAREVHAKKDEEEEKGKEKEKEEMKKKRKKKEESSSGGEDMWMTYLEPRHEGLVDGDIHGAHLDRVLSGTNKCVGHALVGGREGTAVCAVGCMEVEDLGAGLGFLAVSRAPDEGVHVR